MLFSFGQLEKLRSTKAGPGPWLGGEVGEMHWMPLLALAGLQLVKGVVLGAIYTRGWLLFPVGLWPLILSSHGFAVSTFWI